MVIDELVEPIELRVVNGSIAKYPERGVERCRARSRQPDAEDLRGPSASAPEGGNVAGIVNRPPSEDRSAQRKRNQHPLSAGERDAVRYTLGRQSLRPRSVRYMVTTGAWVTLATGAMLAPAFSRGM
jgi:hypothetical protein